MSDASAAPEQPLDADRRPLWLLDVDGVLNAVCGSLPPGYVRDRINGYTITWSPAIIERIAALHNAGRVEVAWLTTWCEDADALLAEPLGLPRGLTCMGSADHKAIHDTWWKSVTAKRVSHGRALIWTDDDLDYAERQGEVDWLRERTGPTFALSPDPRTGLTAADLDRIEGFVQRLYAMAPNGTDAPEPTP